MRLDRDSAAEAASGLIQHTSSTLELPHKLSCRTCVSLLLR